MNAIPKRAHWAIPIASLAVWLAVTCVSTNTSSMAADTSDLVNSILDQTHLTGGFVVHIGSGDGRLTAALRASDRYQVHGLDSNPDNVAKARQYILSTGHYGDVSIDQLNGDRLPYIDNLVNLVVSEDLGTVGMDEVLRVLTPNGTAYIKKGDAWTKTIKPRPNNIDEWTHYLHDASGNAVAHDDVVGPPRHLQWIGTPRWSRHHDRMASMSALVSAGGRIFYVMDEGSRISIELPPKWTLIARDAFNGVVLWKQPIPTWHSHLWPLKSGPTQMARRLVTSSDTVYITLGLRAAVTAIDAATGKIEKVYTNTTPTEELILADEVLVTLVNRNESETGNYAPQLNLGDQRRVAREFRWNEQPRQVMAVDTNSGRLLWKKETRVSPLTLAAAGGQVYFHDGEKVVCLNQSTGEPVWNSPPTTRRTNVTMNFGPKLLVYDKVVLFAGGDRSMTAYSANSGKKLWTAPHAQSGYQSPEDLLVAGGLVWNAPTTRTQDSGIFTGRDPLTGDVKHEFPPNVETYWFHHRCYIAKATDRYLIPSRTGIEFVDHEKKNWDINHWVRGGCLYGIMPCNGLVYAPPHNCACYPEAKLFGFNALAPISSTREVPRQTADAERVQRGPAYGQIQESESSEQNKKDWPTFRHDNKRSGFTNTAVSANLKEAWQTQLGGKLSAVVIASGKLFVAQVDTHTVHALDAKTGKQLWSYTTGGRVDSPPTFYQGNILFGSADGWVYSLRAADGVLAWRFRAAPADQRLMAFEQLESVWPVHGSVLVLDDVVYFVAGRSSFLDGGMRFFKLDAKTGRKIVETNVDELDPETGQNLQTRLRTLQMPVGLPDILSSDGLYAYLRSQKFTLDGYRIEIGPHSGQAAEQGSVQRGVGAHLFAPMGFLDDTWFHRSYWVYGRSFAGGHNGYYQAGKHAPSGRILVFDEDQVYGFGRKPQYLSWTTTIEHQLFASSTEAPPEARSQIEEQKAQRSTRRGKTGASSMIRFAKAKSLDPTGKPLAVAAWVRTEKPNGVIVARGGPQNGYALTLQNGRPRFHVRSENELSSVSTKKIVVGEWTHLVAMLSKDKQLSLYVNGKLAATAKAKALVKADPAQSLEIGADDGNAVGDYTSPFGFTGLIDDLKVFHRVLDAGEIQTHFEDPQKTDVGDQLVLACSFDKGDATDASGNKNHGTPTRVQAVPGKFGGAIRFTGRAGANASGGSFVKHLWDQDVDLLVRAMLKAKDTLFVAGPPDLTDEENAFQRLINRDSGVQSKLAEQDEALAGTKGGLLRAFSAKNGSQLAEYRLDSLPTWDGMAAARESLYLSTTDGKIICLRGAE